ncbi:polysaccharide lyase beta-sandwich domain-containing protein [Streptomyces marokkonensis]|uniref:polysaccharide lyase beta-sandwich domain-containing protein n=1 Tax=Streptomyces marokkonensis TaxID=324855 RepID=UPI003CD05D60
MPGATRRAVARRAADRRRLTVLANDDRCQAVAVPPLGLTAANFWRAGTAGPLTTTAGVSVLIRRRGRTATLCVSEPPRTGEPVEIIWDHPVRASVRAEDTVEVVATGRRLHLRITPGVVCTTHECEVTLS